MAIRSRKKMVVALVSIALVGAGYFLYQKKQQELLSATMKGLDLGERYGRLVPQTQCMPGLKMKHAQCADNACQLSAHGFISACLRTAEKDSFCESVPSPNDTKAAVAWADKMCGNLDMYGTKCESYIHKAVAVCHEQTTGKTRSTGEVFQDGFKRGYETAR